MEKDNPYRRLLDDLCQRVNISTSDHREDFYYVADIKVDDVDFSLMPGSDDNAGALLFFSDFGLIPVEFETIAMRRLLEANLVMMGVGRPNFGINFSTGHVLLSGAVQIAGMDGEKLLAMLRHYASKANTWRQSYFMLDEERQKTASSSPERNRMLKQFERASTNF
ncbi:CesT family type III secretion system chaperone [Herbaspirillum sp. DW155]|uniref:CesT family type III secretion system chaperone n=1 Tax=Herbaspirillum sp. DW155 TaxID=3095609 RepID=UPI0030894D12|nr:CesT family type III secretion system chaperone [Herbaspirillum sp. DW155]